jgi:hypothetical protein
MNDTPRQKAHTGSQEPHMKKPLMISLGFHVVVLLLVIVGLPHFKKDLVLAEPVPVELVANISELTTTNKPPVKAPPKEEKKEEPPKPEKKTPPPQPEPPTPDPKELKEPPKPDKSVDEILDELAPEKKPEKKKEDKKPEKKPVKKPEPKKDDKKDPKPDFDNLLKNLTPDEELPQPDVPPNEQVKDADPSPAPNVSRFSDVLSMSEQDALRQQLSGCWNIMAGAANSEDLAVEVQVVVNPDRTVLSAKVVDQSRYNSDTFFRAAADSALRAVRNPRCTPLNLPPDKYDQWRDMTIVFDPKDMF